MPTTIGLEFTKIFNWDGVGTASSDYIDVTLEAQSPRGTSFTVLNTAAHYLYLGHDEKFDMAVFDIDIIGSLGELTWEYYNGSAWTRFIPGSARLTHDPDFDDMGQPYSCTQWGHQGELYIPPIVDDGELSLHDIDHGPRHLVVINKDVFL